MLHLYLQSFLKKGKRDVGSLTLASFMSISSLVASSLNIAFSENRRNALNNRFQAMDALLTDLKDGQNILSNNVRILKENEEFLGLETQLVVYHLNLLQSVHSCEVMDLNFEIQIGKFESRLGDLLAAVYDHKLRHTMISRRLLEEMTMQNYFGDMIYRISPSLLYELARIDLLSFENGKLNFAITFPVIGRTFEYKLVNILEAPQKLVMSLPSIHNFRSFLIPFDMELANVTNNVNEIRSARSCIETETFLACPSNEIEDFSCVASMFGSEKECLVNNVALKEFAFQYDYRQKGALINLRQGAKLVNTFSNTTLFEMTNSNETLYFHSTDAECLNCLKNRFCQTLSEC